MVPIISMLSIRIIINSSIISIIIIIVILTAPIIINMIVIIVDLVGRRIIFLIIIILSIRIAVIIISIRTYSSGRRTSPGYAMFDLISSSLRASSSSPSLLWPQSS